MLFLWFTTISMSFRGGFDFHFLFPFPFLKNSTYPFILLNPEMQFMQCIFKEMINAPEVGMWWVQGIYVRMLAKV